MRTEIIKRYFWLLDAIYRAGDVGITFEEINEKWERNDLLSGGHGYPKRTFESHRQNIEEIFNILIDCDRRTNRYFISDREELKNQNHILKWLVETFNLNDIVGQSKNLKDRIGLLIAKKLQELFLIGFSAQSSINWFGIWLKLTGILPYHLPAFNVPAIVFTVS